MTRFQDSPWYVRLWRRHQYWRVPLDAAGLWFLGLDWPLCWDVAVGEARLRMEWYYTPEELHEKLK